MASLGQVGARVRAELRDRVDWLVAAVEDDACDFAEVARRARSVGELTEAIAEVYSEVEQTLMQGLQRDAAPERDVPREQLQEKPVGEGKQHSQSESDDSTAAQATKEELLERAREVDVQGRSSMSKEELAQAVEADENLTREELLERAREAGISGRSSMTKKELRTALRGARTGTH